MNTANFHRKKTYEKTLEANTNHVPSKNFF